MSETDNRATGAAQHEHMKLADQLARLIAPDNESDRILAFTAIANLVDDFTRLEGQDRLRRVQSALLGGPHPEGMTGRIADRAARAVPAPVAASPYSDPTFLANASRLIASLDPTVPTIVGGVVDPDEHPDCVAVGSETVWSCSGTLVAPNAVLTAAHCVDDGGAKRVLIGGSVDDRSAQIVRVASVWPHPDYDRPANDLCLLILEDDVDVRPRALADAAMLEGASFVRVAGFGRTDSSGTTGGGNRRKVDVPLASNDAKYGADCVNEFVAGSPALDRDSCDQDSGGPAYVRAGDDWYLLGVTSRKTDTAIRPCGDGGIYVLVPAYANWIHEAVTG